MATVNKPVKRVVIKRKLSAYDKLRRTIMASLLWEDNFYENGESAADRVAQYMTEVTPAQAEKALMEAKFDNKLRHMPLYLMTQMAKNKMLSADQVAKVITRVDDMSELIALYQKDEANKHMIPHSIQKGMAKAFPKFDEYQFAKYRGDKKEIKLKDVIRLAHPKPETDEQSKLWKKIVDGTLATPDTWEVALSAGGDKKETWTRLLKEHKLGALALLRNLNGMTSCGVDENLIKDTIKDTGMNKILPFQIVNAAQHAPDCADILEEKFFESVNECPHLDGDTIVLVDVSGSMSDTLSQKSDMMRVTAAAALATLCKEICANVRCYTFTDELKKLKSSTRGFSLVDTIVGGLGGCTAVKDCTNDAIKEYQSNHDGAMPKRVIVITDEQTNSDYDSNLINLPRSSKGYMINVGTYEKGIDYGGHSGWTTISGWSDNIVKYIAAVENKKN